MPPVPWWYAEDVLIQADEKRAARKDGVKWFHFKKIAEISERLGSHFLPFLGDLGSGFSANQLASLFRDFHDGAVLLRIKYLNIF